MTPTDLRALAPRVLAEGPSRELDADIWDAIGLTADDEARTTDAEIDAVLFPNLSAILNSRP